MTNQLYQINQVVLNRSCLIIIITILFMPPSLLLNETFNISLSNLNGTWHQIAELLSQDDLAYSGEKCDEYKEVTSLISTLYLMDSFSLDNDT